MEKVLFWIDKVFIQASYKGANPKGKVNVTWLTIRPSLKSKANGVKAS